MNMLTLTNHAAARMAQRGILPNDAELIVLIGTEVDDGYLVRDKDYQLLELAMKTLLKRFERLVGKRLVTSEGRIVTAYHASKKRQRRLMRSSRDSNLWT